jgi:hypothetical protein
MAWFSRRILLQRSRSKRRGDTMSYWIEKAEDTLEKSDQFLSDETVEEAGVMALIAIAVELVHLTKAVENLDQKETQ